MKSNEAPTGLATFPEAAKFLGIARSTLYKLTYSGDVPTRQIGNINRIPWAWLHAQAEVPKPKRKRRAATAN